jgi:hypothetical protein
MATERRKGSLKRSKVASRMMPSCCERSSDVLSAINVAMSLRISTTDATPFLRLSATYDGLDLAR